MSEIEELIAHLETQKTTPTVDRLIAKVKEQDREIKELQLGKEAAERLNRMNVKVADRETDRAEKAEDRIWELKEMVALLLLMIEHETNLPDGAANGVVTNDKSDEGIVRARQIMDEAFQLLRNPTGGELGKIKTRHTETQNLDRL